MNRLKRVTGACIHTFAKWNVWATLTFRLDVSEPFALELFREWRVKIANRRHMRIAFACEPQRCGRLHFHVLVALPPEAIGEGESTERMHARLARDWHALNSACGRTEFKAFDETRGAAWYAAKHKTWMVDVVCPRASACRRRKGCVELHK